MDSCDTRILCSRVGIFGMKEEAAMHQFLDSVVRHRNMVTDAAIEFCVQRWEEYTNACPDLKWTYGSAFRFFMSGLAFKSDCWPWKDGPPRQPGVVKVYKNPDLDRARDEWIRDNRPDLAKKGLIQ
jgi:hypothetical protein